jgi:hypothetical protein
MKFEKVIFDGKDFPEWKFWFETMMMGYGLLDLIESKIKEDEALSPEFIAKNKSAYVMIVLCLSKTTVQKIRNIKRGDGRAAWKKLNEEYERNTRASRIGLRRQLYDIGRHPRELGETLDMIDSYCARLGFMKVIVSDDEKLAVLLSMQFIK